MPLRSVRAKVKKGHQLSPARTNSPLPFTMGGGVGSGMPAGSKSILTAAPPILKTSPYMFYHGEPSKDPGEEIPVTSPFRNSDLGDALFNSYQEFTDGAAPMLLTDVRERQDQSSRIRSTGGTFVNADPRNENIARVHRLVTSTAVKEAARILAKKAPMAAAAAAAASPASPTSKSKVLSPTASSVPNTANAFTTALFAKAASEIRIASLIRIFKEEYNITNRTLLNKLSDGLQHINDRLHENNTVSSVDTSSSMYPDATPGSIPVAAFMELMDIYVNGAMSTMTRHACFNIFDAQGQRVITSKFLRSLRGAKEHTIREMTNGGTFDMLKALLDMFSHNNEELSTTLTVEQLTPLFDIDEGQLVDGFMEEILRQICVQEFNAVRSALL